MASPWPRQPPAPAGAVDDKGVPLYGIYEGAFGEANLRPALGNRLQRLYRLKRWQYTVLATPEVLCAFATVDVGYVANGFAYVIDLVKGQTVLTKGFLGPSGLALTLTDRPGDGAKAHFGIPGVRIRQERKVGSPSWTIEARFGELELDALLDTTGAPPAMSAILPVPGGIADCTVKWALLPLAGTLKVGTRQWNLSGGFGGGDFTHGVLPRKTTWRWAYGLGRTKDGERLAFNLTEGLSDAPPEKNEFAVWVGDRFFLAPQPHFTFDAKHPETPWKVRTDDGTLDLTFTPKGMHREDRNLGLIVSRFAQVGGLFSGTVRDPDGVVHTLVAVPGVTEDQDVVW